MKRSPGQSLPELPEPRSEYYESQRIRMHYVVWEGGATAPMLLIHGGQDHCRNWDFVAARLMSDYSIYAPDLRGHGDSGWAIGGMYSLPEFVLDVATLANSIEGKLTIIGHSLGGGVALQYAGIFPDKVEKVVSIEGWGPPIMERRPAHIRMREWIGHMHGLERRTPRRYTTIEDATKRMMEANPHLTPQMARHLTIHGAGQNDDGSYSWKFDNYVRIRSPYEFNIEDAKDIWAKIEAPVLLIRGSESWAADPDRSGRGDAIRDHRTVVIPNAGHWAHHDQLDEFMSVVKEFLKE